MELVRDVDFDRPVWLLLFLEGQGNELDAKAYITWINWTSEGEATISPFAKRRTQGRRRASPILTPESAKRCDNLFRMPIERPIANLTGFLQRQGGCTAISLMDPFLKTLCDVSIGSVFERFGGTAQFPFIKGVS